MDYSIDSIVSHPQLSLVSDSNVDNKEESCDKDVGLTGAELDDLMNNHFCHMIDVMNDGIFYMCQDDTVCFYNPSFYARFGIESGHTDLSTWLDLVHPHDRAQLEGAVDEHIQQNDVRITTQYRVRCVSGQYVWLEGTAVTKTIKGQRFMIGLHKDVSDKKLMETYIRQSSTTDDSSGLSNEKQLSMDLDNLLGIEGESYHLIYIQPEVTRAYTTLHGSQVMLNLLTHLRKVFGYFPENVVDIYRIHSQDFAVIVEGDIDEAALNKLARRISRVYKKAVKSVDFLFANKISLGIYPNINVATTSDEIIEISKRTCQLAASQTSNNVRSYSCHTKQQIDRKLYVEQELANAISERKLSVKFQPIVCCQSQRIASFESLVRWRSKEFGEIYPDEFIALAEEQGLISELGYFVFEKACQFINSYQKRHTHPIKVNVNVSVLQLLSHQFPDILKQMTKMYDVNASSIVLELTETIILDDNKEAISQLYRLKDLGFQLSLDDFGAGYSSLNSFFDLPLSQIKIDKSIAWRSIENPVTFEYLTFITNLCNSYGISIVIEGIEDAGMQKLFTDMGASYLQGYWFAKPLSLASASHYTKI